MKIGIFGSKEDKEKVEAAASDIIKISKDSVTTYLPKGNHSLICRNCKTHLGSFRIEKNSELIAAIMKCDKCNMHTLAANIKSY